MGERRDPSQDDEATAAAAEDGSDSLGPLPELIRRAAALGLSGFFMTETALRKALGDTMPKEWVDFAAGQGERYRSDLMERLGDEMARMIQNMDMVEMIDQVMAGRTLEINAKIRLGERSADDGEEETDRPVEIRIKSG
jgi:hypothetical protein